ncbi:tRNA (N6-isopentenyl adenosine(37)-C2)-methylthiotransferase MiaB [Gracilinema caldarium]|uniref:tRNA (N6-isopentenyl adenosine(37)-C2)-methylthiotransferase MiaB n=1 Tax=Gracilinema caldarium TaxID=215591 RepID=UPI0026E972BA|nr:tRNA (N6-isopentenyl adenosine(37)-C2)-methylthiotransferase MiaB [Gracilinema caldarium]
MTYFFETYGCQMNIAESAALQMILKERGWQEASSADTADLILLNTCSVRATAEKRVMGRLAQYQAAKRQRPFTLIVAGCMAERLGDKLKEKIPAVDYVMGTSSRSTFPLILDAVEEGKPLVLTDEKPAFAFSSSHLEEGQFRSFVPIMHGCNNFCSYCIVPYVRGREISRDPQSIVDEIRLLADRGVREITLLGQNVNSYQWKDGNRSLDFPGLLELVAETVEQSPIRWVRFLSSHPKDLSSRAIQVMAQHRVFARHLHLCVQHGSDRILEAMNRRYTKSRYLELVAEIREAMPDISLSTDILIGFPGETEEDVQDTLSLMEEVRFLYSYMYHYNPREGTAAYKLPNRIPEPIKKERLSRVIELQKQHTKEQLKSRLGQKTRILLEGISRKNADELLGRTERDEMVVVPGSPAYIGTFVEVTLSALRGNTFHAKEIVPCQDA